MERYKIYQSLPEQGLFKNTETGDIYIITTNPSVRIKNPTETALKMLKDKAFERPTFIPSIDEINANLSENIQFNPSTNTYSSKLGDLVFNSKFLEEVEEKIKKTLLDRKSNSKYIVKDGDRGYRFSMAIPVSDAFKGKKKRIVKSFKTKDEAMDYRDKFLKVNNMERFLNSNCKHFEVANEIKFPAVAGEEPKKDLNEKYIYLNQNGKWTFVIQSHYIFGSRDKEEVIKCRDEFFKVNGLILQPGARNPSINWDKIIFPNSIDFPKRRRAKSPVKRLTSSDFKEKFFKPYELYLTPDGDLLTEEELTQRIMKSEHKMLTVRKVDMSKVAEVSVKIC